MKNCKLKDNQASGGICTDKDCQYFIPPENACQQCALHICKTYKPVDQSAQLTLDFNFQ